MKIEYLDSIDSTNTYLLNKIRHGELTCPYAVVANEQTAGRGRNGKTWDSKPEQGLYFSIAYYFPTIPNNLSCLSLVSGVAVLNILRQYYAELPFSLKWPNDIYLQGRKCAGILCESISCSHSKGIWIVTGIGLNLFLTESQKMALNAVSLYDFGIKLNDIRLLAAEIADSLKTAFSLFSQQGFNAFLKAWSDVDFLSNKAITIEHPYGLLSGIARGISADGALLLEGHHGLQKITMGEVSVRFDQGCN